MPEVPLAARARVRGAVAEMMAADGAGRQGVVEQVLYAALDWAQRARLGHDLPAALAEDVPGHPVTVRPDFGFAVDETSTPGAEAVDVADVPDAVNVTGDDVEAPEDDELPGERGAAADGLWRMLGLISAWGVHPLQRTTEAGWAASGVERLALLLRARSVPVGLVTDGRWWALVWAPLGGTTGAAVWDASLWGEEPETFRAFVALLTRRRFLGAAATDTLPLMLHESLAAQEEVTVTLGRQVRDAVELLLATLDRLDRLDAESAGRLLGGVSDDALYDGVVTVMMRLVFLLFAEERRLLPSDDAVYTAGYGVARLVEQLEQAAAVAGEQSLEHRTGAWHRLLAVSRALHRGVAHEDLRLPAYGGGLFDPDRYPWLEGRRAGGTGADAAARPPAVDDRTVLRMLRAVQYVKIAGERRKLTFRALDVEQIGYVYEGLLELEVRTATDVVLGVQRPAAWPKGKVAAAAEVPLSQVTAWAAEAPPRLAQRLKERTGRSESWVEQHLLRQLETHEWRALLRAAGRDVQLAEQLVPVAGVLRWDAGVPAVTLPGRRYIAPGSRRASTGTHYTPRSLAEDIVVNTLEPLAYRPGPLETADRNTWRIRPSSQILDLRVADIAMGSGAFLVAACRYLADRLVEAWVAEGRADAVRHRSGQPAADTEVAQVELAARRLVAEHCLYGVDINPLAVDMAKLSLWLVTMDRERPFGFLDDRLQCGDSLLGLTSVEQLETLHVDPVAGRRLTADAFDFSAEWRSTLGQAADVRRQITAVPVVTARDVEHKQRLLADAQALSEPLQAVADAVTATGLTAAKTSARLTDAAFLGLGFTVQLAMPDDPGKLDELVETLQAGRPAGTAPRRPLHWPLVFPEVFADARDTGFDAIVGNPPFLGGKKISGALGDDYLAWLARWDGKGVKGNTDLAARFVLRAELLLSSRGQLGYITTNTLVQGDTLEVGLARAVERGMTIRRGRSSHPWPSASANLEIVDVWASRAPVAKRGVRWLDGEEVPSIGADLEPVGRVEGVKHRLRENEGVAFQGHNVLGLGFTLTHEQAVDLISQDQRNADVMAPYVIGQDLNQRPDCSASRWIINFREWPRERAETYPDAFTILKREVRPSRITQNVKKYPRMVNEWWKFWQYRQGLEAAITDLDHVLAVTRHSSAVMPLRVPSGSVFDSGTAIFAMDDFASLAILSSSPHTVWVVRYTSTLGTGIRYAPSDIVLTLPRPALKPQLAAFGERLDTERRALMLGRGWGLTTTYNHVHDPADRDPEVQALRELHAEIDHAVLDAYGWSDLDPRIGHHPTKIGTRWTVSKEARFELLDRLLEENQRRHAAETS